MSGALLRYRILAYVVGVILVVLTLVAMPLKYLRDEPFLVEAIGPLHGFLYMVYLLFALQLALKLDWPWKRTVLILLAGTVPFVSFVAERRVTREVHERQAAQDSAASRSNTPLSRST